MNCSILIKVFKLTILCTSKDWSSLSSKVLQSVALHGKLLTRYKTRLVRDKRSSMVFHRVNDKKKKVYILSRFTPDDGLVKLEDVQQFFDFVTFCRDKIDNQKIGLNDKVGYLKVL